MVSNLHTIWSDYQNATSPDPNLCKALVRTAEVAREMYLFDTKPLLSKIITNIAILLGWLLVFHHLIFNDAQSL